MSCSAKTAKSAPRSTLHNRLPADHGVPCPCPGLSPNSVPCCEGSLAQAQQGLPESYVPTGAKISFLRSQRKDRAQWERQGGLHITPKFSVEIFVGALVQKKREIVGNLHKFESCVPPGCPAARTGPSPLLMRIRFRREMLPTKCPNVFSGNTPCNFISKNTSKEVFLS